MVHLYVISAKVGMTIIYECIRFVGLLKSLNYTHT